MKKEITFSFPAEAMQGATEIYLLGDFNNWSVEDAIKFEYAMDGFFKAVAELEEGQSYHYRFLLDNGRWVNDHNAESYVVIPELYVDNCVITIPMSALESNVPEMQEPAKHTEKKTAGESKTKSSAKPKNAGQDAPKAKAESVPGKQTAAEPKKTNAQSAPAKSTAAKKPVGKAAKGTGTSESKSASSEKEVKSDKTVKKSAPKGKK